MTLAPAVTWEKTGVLATFMGEVTGIGVADFIGDSDHAPLCFAQ